MLKKSLKVTAAIILALNMCTPIVCNADELSANANTIDVSMVRNYVATTTTTSSTTENITSDSTTTTETDITASVTTTPFETTSVTTTSDTSVTTTSETTTESTTTELTGIGIKPTDDIDLSNLLFIEESLDFNLINSLSYEEKLILIQNEVDEYLYNTTQLSPDDALKIIKNYIKWVCVYNEISGCEVVYLYKYAKDIVDHQNLIIKKNELFYENLNTVLDNVTYSNYSGIENYCKYLIRSGFKQQILSSKETLSLMKSIHDIVISRLSDWELDLVKYEDYSFISNQTLVTKWNVSYPDMKGWIYISGSTVDYPLMQYSDNNYYLQHSWNGAESSRGTIELDYRSTLTGIKDSTDSTENVLIYGHNLNDNTMFSSLANYKKESYYKEHQLIEISTLEGQRLYKIYAVCSIYGLADGTKFKYWDDKYVSMDEETFEEHLKLTKENILYDIDDYPEFGQDILTLQTCDGSNGWRVVIFAKRVK